MSMDGIAYIQWSLDAREAAGLQPIPYSYPESKAPSEAPKTSDPKKVADIKDAKANADAASVMSTSSFGSHIGLLKEKMKSKSKKESQ